MSIHCSTHPQACRNGFAEIVTTLLYAGADVNVRSALGVTPLLQATQAGRSRIVREILDNGRGVDINYGVYARTRTHARTRPRGWLPAGVGSGVGVCVGREGS